MTATSSSRLLGQRLGGPWFTRRIGTDKHRDHRIRQLDELGYGVSLTDLAA